MEEPDAALIRVYPQHYSCPGAGGRLKRAARYYHSCTDVFQTHLPHYNNRASSYQGKTREHELPLAAGTPLWNLRLELELGLSENFLLKLFKTENWIFNKLKIFMGKKV